MKKTTILLTFVLLVSFSFAQVQRVVLLEHFTQASCGPCATYNPAIEDLLSNNTNDLVCINYHVSWPGYDPMYFHNTSDVDNRVSYYNVSGVPNSVLDGSYYNGHPAGWGQSDIDTRLNASSKLSINLTPKFSPAFDSVIVTMDIVAESSISSAVRAHIVIVEKNVSFSTPPGTNGEKDFSYVMKKMLPNAGGTEIESMVEGESYQIVGRWKIDNLYQMNQIAVVAFVQNHDTKEMYQAAYKKLNFAAMYSLDANIKGVDNVEEKVCLTTISPKIKMQSLGSSNITSLTFSYKFNNEETHTYNWDGSLGFFESTVIELPEVSYNQLASNNTFEVQVTKVNGSNDGYSENNTFIQEFDQAPTATNTLYFKFKPDDDPEQSTWHFKKSGGSVLYDGGPYSSSETTLQERTFKVEETGCYELTVFDANNDGLKDGGYYKLEDLNGLTLITGREFDDKETTIMMVRGVPAVTMNYEDGATDVPLDAVFVLTFEEPLRQLDDDPIEDIEEYLRFQERALEGPTVGFSATINETADEITLTPNSELSKSTNYFITILEGLEGDLNNYLPETSFGITTTSGVSSIEDINNQVFTIYPNPSSENLYVTLNTEVQNSFVLKMYNSCGQLVKEKYGFKNSEKEMIELNCNEFENGLYFINLSFGEKNYSKKHIIKK